MSPDWRQQPAGEGARVPRCSVDSTALLALPHSAADVAARRNAWYACVACDRRLWTIKIASAGTTSDGPPQAAHLGAASCCCRK